MPELEVLTTADRDRWLTVLDEIGQFDFYHLPQYHELAERMGEGQGRLLVYREAEHLIALPLLFRSCATVEGLEGEASQDAGSVYGYAGPLSTSPTPPSSVITRFQESVQQSLGTVSVASVFSRLNPLFDQAPLIDGLGETVPNGTTVSIDLTLPPEEQVGQYRSNHARGIRKLRNQGATCELDESGWIGQFVEIYHETMHRVGAAPRYFFDRTYFEMLDDLLGSRIRFFSCRLGGEVIAAGLFFVCGNVVQYHLGATRSEYVSLGPMKLIIDTVRQWATEAGLELLHLGGGLGAQEDSLFDFKAGFSDKRHQFETWRWAPDLERYARLTARKSAWNAERGLHYLSTDFFPLYRSRVTDVDPASEPEGPDEEEPAPPSTIQPTTMATHGSSPPASPAGRKMPNVLMTAAGRRTSLILAFGAELRRRGGRILAADVDPLAPALFLADGAVRLRPTNDPAYVGDLLALVERCEVGLLVPTIDPDLPVLSEQRATLKDMGCVAAVSNEAFVALTADKLATVQTFGDQGIAVPESWLAGDRTGDWPDHVFIKPRRGSASLGARIARRRDIEVMDGDIDELIVQEVLTGPEITIDALLDLEGRPIHYVPRARVRTLAGESIEGVTLDHDPSLERWIESLLEICGSLGAAGPLCLQAFLTGRGPVLSEINARFGGGYPLGLAAGGLYPSWLLDMAEGIPVASRLGEYESGLYMTRYHTEHFTRSPHW